MPGRSAPPMPLRPADVMQQRVDERAARVPGRRVHDHARRLVDDDEVVVFVEDRERQRFGRAASPRAGAGTSTSIVESGRDDERRAWRGRADDADVPVVESAAGPATATAPGRCAREELIEALPASSVRRDDDSDAAMRALRVCAGGMSRAPRRAPQPPAA